MTIPSPVTRLVRAQRGWGPAATSTDRRLRASGGVVVLLHVVLLVVVEWAVLSSLLAGTFGDGQRSIPLDLAAVLWRTVAIEMAVLLAGGVAAIGIIRSGRSRRPATSQSISVFLLAWSPAAIYSAGVLIALAGGWKPDVQFFSSPEATPTQVADTIREALPVIMQPLTTGRHVANAAAMLLLSVLLYRLCGVDAKRSITADGVAGIIATLAIVLT